MAYGTGHPSLANWRWLANDNFSGTGRGTTLPGGTIYRGSPMVADRRSRRRWPSSQPAVTPKYAFDLNPIRKTPSKSEIPRMHV
jgi:hypothetical protein